MNVSSLGQANIFFLYSICGICVGIIFDFFRSVRRIYKSNNKMVALQDSIFWIVVTVSFYISMLCINNGEIRWFEFLGAGLGFLIYFFGASVFLKGKIEKFIIFVIKMSKLVIKILLTPVVFLYKIIKKPCKIIFWGVSVFAKRLNKIANRAKNNFKGYKLFRKKI